MKKNTMSLEANTNHGAKSTRLNRSKDVEMQTLLPTNHESVFQNAWADPSNTRFELPPVNINEALAEHYGTSEPFTFTRTMTWDMEVRKALKPDDYIRSVVQEGSAHSWDQHLIADGTEIFVRSSLQRLWLEPKKLGLVLELVSLNHTEQKVTFIGALEDSDQSNNLFRVIGGQPLFHVEHSVGGEEREPLNRWRIVHLTDGPDRRLIERFKVMANNVLLPEFIENYIRNDLNIGLAAK
ncbi:hypothetical protein [Sulfitobacter sp.]|uniref:hypothetical protein n=1 Tax=Sulfitobacter sp. TaxID=1903071 RepID=UPI0030012663